MADSAPVSNHGVGGRSPVPGRAEAGVRGGARERGVAGRAEGVRREVDRVELSAQARRAQEADLPPQRRALVERVRGEIEAGTYVTPERLAVAAYRLAQELGLDR